MAEKKERRRGMAFDEDGPFWWRSAGIPALRDEARRKARAAGWMRRDDLARIGWEYWEQPDGTIRILTLNGNWAILRDGPPNDVGEGGTP